MEVRELQEGPDWVDLREIEDNKLIWLTYNFLKFFYLIFILNLFRT